MARVLTALLSPDGHGDISVSIIASLSGDDVGSFLLPAGSVVADLERVLRDPHGPMFGRAWSRVLFYTEEEPSKTLGLQLQLGTFSSLVMKHGDLEAWLYTFPDTGKFLEAMQGNRFDPRSPNFHVRWTAASAPALLADKAECMVHEVLSGSPIHEDSGPHFVQIFGKLTSLGEQCNYLNLALLQNFDPGLRMLKHCISQHWLELARLAATSMISEATPILLPKRADRGSMLGCSLIGGGFPGNFDRALRNSLCLCDLRPRFCWSEFSHALVSLDWNPQEGRTSLRNLMEKIAQEPREFVGLQHQEISQMVHVQLRLSCCGVAKVKGSINEACVKILTELLAYKLRILRFQAVQGVPELMSQMSDFECDASHRGTVVLVTDLPVSTSKIFPGPHRMILCYNWAVFKSSVVWCLYRCCVWGCTRLYYPISWGYRNPLPGKKAFLTNQHKGSTEGFEHSSTNYCKFSRRQQSFIDTPGPSQSRQKLASYHSWPLGGLETLDWIMLPNLRGFPVDLHVYWPWQD